MAKVRFDAVRKVYPNGYVGVAGATFEVADGELLVLVGPSGCGKSTLLRMVAGLEAISDGTLTIGSLLPQSGDLAFLPTPGGWHLTIGCWKGTTDTLREMIAGNDWPEAEGEQIIVRRPMLEAMAYVCDAYAAANPDALAEVKATAARWKEER